MPRLPVHHNTGGVPPVIPDEFCLPEQCHRLVDTEDGNKNRRKAKLTMFRTGSLPARSVFSRQWYARLWQTPLGQHNGDFAQRYLAYVLSPVLICMLTYFAMHYLGVSHFPGYYKFNLLYHHRYALETALNFGFWLYVAEEWASRLLGQWAARDRRTVGATCLLWSGGFLIALVLQLTLIYERIDLYAPKIMHFFDLYPLRRPSLMLRLAIFGAIWFITLNSRLAIGLWLQQLTERNRQNHEQEGAYSNHEGETRYSESSQSGMDIDESVGRKPLVISTGKWVSTVQPETLACITSEGHYCRFILKTEEKKNEIFTRAALKDIIAELPPEDFIQIHRSHVINKRYIERLKKSGRSYSLVMVGEETPLPISRYRWPSIRDRLDRSCQLDLCSKS